MYVVKKAFMLRVVWVMWKEYDERLLKCVSLRYVATGYDLLETVVGRIT
jgi:hypothetical protein